MVRHLCAGPFLVLRAGFSLSRKRHAELVSASYFFIGANSKTLGRVDIQCIKYIKTYISSFPRRRGTQPPQETQVQGEDPPYFSLR